MISNPLYWHEYVESDSDTSTFARKLEYYFWHINNLDSLFYRLYRNLCITGPRNYKRILDLILFINFANKSLNEILSTQFIICM